MTVQSIGRYRVLRELGRGTLATVYLARDPASGQQVAVKVLADNVTAGPDFDARFQAEMQAVKALDHPALVKVVDFGHEGSQYFIVKRYLPGGTLESRLEGKPLLLAEVVPILKRLADALDAAHTAGIVHGNLSPNNVLFDLHDRAYLADLGLSHLIAPAVGPELSGAPEYMSPEQAQGGAIDGRSDVYSLGAMLYEMLTGQQPFAADSAFQLLRSHIEQPVPQLSDDALARLVLPAEFNQVLARAMAKNPDERYPTAGVLAEAVRARFVMPPTPDGATIPAAAAAAAASAPTLPSAPAPPSPPPAAPFGAGLAGAPGPTIVGEMVREPEAPPPRARVPMLAACGRRRDRLDSGDPGLASLTGIAGRLRNGHRHANWHALPGRHDNTPDTGWRQRHRAGRLQRHTRPHQPRTALARPGPAPHCGQPPALRTRPRLPPAPPCRPEHAAPQPPLLPTTTHTRAPAFTQTSTPTPSATLIPPTSTSTATLTPQPPGPTNTPAPTATPTDTSLPLATDTETPTITPTPSNTPIPINTP